MLLPLPAIVRGPAGPAAPSASRAAATSAVAERRPTVETPTRPPVSLFALAARHDPGAFAAGLALSRFFVLLRRDQVAVVGDFDVRRFAADRDLEAAAGGDAAFGLRLFTSTAQPGADLIDDGVVAGF